MKVKEHAMLEISNEVKRHAVVIECLKFLMK